MNRRLTDLHLAAPGLMLGALATAASPAPREGSPDAEIGRTYLLAGQAGEAIAHLRTAVAECDLFDAPVQHVRAARDLGRALEKKGDTAGACEAYGKVLAQWGHAKPRSVTADEARARVKALGCKL
jgi:Flp pilus assembly protein TadD